MMPSNLCKRCGRCMTVCPVYQTTFREADVARGRLAVLERTGGHKIHRSGRLPDILSRCLLCGACAQACVNNVDPPRWIQQARQAVVGSSDVRSMGRLLVKSVRRAGVSSRILAKGGALFESLFCETIPASSGLHLRFPLSFFSKRSVIPQIARRPFLDHTPVSREGAQNKRVALFVGCGANFLFPEAPRALVRILEKMGVYVHIPKDQVCCGLPAYVAGDTETARALAIKNMEAFQPDDFDALLTVCASCGAHIEHMAQAFENDPIVGQTARVWKQKHRDAMRFLVEDLALDAYLQDLAGSAAKNGPAVRAAYHDPCHLRIGQGGSQAPRRLLQNLPGVVLKEAPHEGRCCGHGGDFNLLHFDVSMSILAKRMEDFQRARPDVIVTGCTGCLLQFQEGVERFGLQGKVGVCHPLMLVDRALYDRKK